MIMRLFSNGAGTKVSKLNRSPTSFFLILFCLCLWWAHNNGIECMSKNEKRQYKEKVVQMFDHAFGSYMKYAFPADEIMPISCKGRYRNVEKSRGDIDEVLGNYSLTLIDTLDTLALLGKIEEFETGVRDVIKNVHFDRDIIISVFESNIRILGGLLGGHVSLIYLRDKQFASTFSWYNDELLFMAKDLADRLLPAFNTSSGLPMSRVNLKHGLTDEILYNEKDRFTCTACAGTLLLEFATLSRLTGEPVYEDKAKQALSILWNHRNRASDLVGTVINVENGEWAVKDSNIGAGIDSYYEYLFKGYMLLGDNELLQRFNRHYESLAKYNTLNANDGMKIGDGAFMKTVPMHQPSRQSKSYIDSLLAFWPGLQVLKGDIKGAIKMHETLYQIVKRYDFLPEAVLFDHSAHWVGHPLRPEFLESTYFLYKATNDNYYLHIARRALNQLETHARVKCGYAAISDVRTKANEDRMDSFVFAELFKYFYLIFSEEKDMLFDLDEFVFTTEAHMLPIKMADYTQNTEAASKVKTENKSPINWSDKSCPSLKQVFDPKDKNALKNFRNSVLTMSKSSCEKKSFDGATSPNKFDRKMPLHASQFVVGNKEHMHILSKMGIKLKTMTDGRVQLVHKTTHAHTLEDAEIGILFMTEMLELSKQQDFQLKSNLYVDDYRPMSIVLMSKPFYAAKQFQAGPAQFGYDFRRNFGMFGRLLLAEPFDACQDLSFEPGVNVLDKIIVAKRGACIFIDKARAVQKAGALGLIIIDNVENTSYSPTTIFSMSGDGKTDIEIPSLFLFSNEGKELLWEMRSNKDLIVFVGDNLQKPKAKEPTENNEPKAMSGAEKALYFNPEQLVKVLSTERSSKAIRFTDLLKINQANCPSYFYSVLEEFYTIYNPAPFKQSVDMDDIEVLEVLTETINLDEYEGVLVFDETIHLVFESDTEKYLDINLDPITSLESQIEARHRLDGEKFVQQIFEILFNRFEETTNIGNLNNKQVYTNTLYNYVRYTLNPQNSNLTGNDKTFLKLLAGEIKSKSNSNLAILTRKKTSRPSSSGSTEDRSSN